MEIVIILLGLSVLILLYARSLLISEAKKRKEQIRKLVEENEKLRLLNKELSKFQGILDIEKAAQEILLKANSDAEIMKSEARIELENARINANEIRSDAKIKADENIKKTEISLMNATIESKRIIESANKRAEEIAGEAFIAMKNANNYEKTVKAMKNIIEGYGDNYLVPTYSLLDDLAEEFSHTDAGNNLKTSRERSLLMIKKGLAAKCDYVEANRKETAINFVLDAFNGKVDSILSKVKKDNFGTLEQKIKDSFVLVNYNGKAFKNAQITNDYYDSRMEELKWAVIAQELKWQEQEEQRRIKEQIREEEKARREYEKAIKDAQKEEDTLKRLIEKAQSQVNQASVEQKAMFEEKLKELEEKLQAAEEKNQRAISMAQQTKSGNVYVISNIGSFGENVYKIGMTRRLEPLDRIKELGDASVPFEFDVHAMIYSDDAPKLENDLHKRFLLMQMNKVNPRKEFFKIGISDIKEEVEKFGVKTKWTLLAEAKQYRESKAIEETLLKDSKAKEEWEKFQLNFESEIENDTEILNN